MKSWETLKNGQLFMAGTDIVPFIEDFCQLNAIKPIAVSFYFISQNQSLPSGSTLLNLNIKNSFIIADVNLTFSSPVFVGFFFGSKRMLGVNLLNNYQLYNVIFNTIIYNVPSPTGSELNFKGYQIFYQ